MTTLGGGSRQLIRLALVAATLAVYAQTAGFAFVSFDDGGYVYGNAVVRRGLTREGVRWAFTAFHMSNWHPLTWLSHMADVSLFGMDAGRHHLVNAGLHAANALLVFQALGVLTGAWRRSAFVAALFALHPLHVESVAWVAERKDLLCALFFLLALWSYAGYARRGGGGRYGLVVLWFVLGLLAKPMILTLPFVLLLLDVWPLGRLAPSASGGGGIPSRGETARRLVLEKAPLFALTILSCAVTYAAQSEALVPLALDLPAGQRAANAVVSTAAYLWKAAWPASLSVFYPHPASLREVVPLWKIALSAAVVAGISALAFRERKRRPYLAAGWLWYLGMLIPVIGLVQVGAQAMADRYTYLPLTGVFLAGVFGAADLAKAARVGRRAAAALGGAVLLALGAASWVQASHWRDGELLYRHALKATTGNWLAHNNLGSVLYRQGRAGEALYHYREALRIRPDYPEALSNMGDAMYRTGRLAEAVDYFERAVSSRPEFADTRYNLAVALYDQGRAGEAVAQYEEVIRRKPEHALAHNNLGDILRRAGDAAGAERHFREAVRLEPDNLMARRNLANLLFAEGRRGEAALHLREVVLRDPGDVEARRKLGEAAGRGLTP